MLTLAVLGGFALAMVGIGAWAERRVQTVEDYVVAGRRLGVGLASATLLATWFGAGTLLVASDEVRREGVRAAALDPIGAGVCLLIAGIWLAGPLWARRLTTLADLYATAFGPRAERWASWLMVPGYLGWVAAQFTALAGLLVAVAGLDPGVALGAVAGVGIGYTLLGGMWAVTVTDAVQLGLVVLGLLAMAAEVLARLGGLGDGAVALWVGAPAAQRVWVPDGDAGVVWASAFLAGALGNLPGQDLSQRIAAARSASTARWACGIAGVAYLTLGAVPVLLALAVDRLAPGASDGSLIHLAQQTLTPPVALLFTLAVAAAVLSTIDSAILAPATVVARNLLGRRWPETVRLHRVAVAGVGLASLGTAALGEDAYALLEASYEVTLASLLVPMLGALFRPRHEGACLAAMATGTAAWLGHTAVGADGLLGTPVPVGIGAAGLAAVAYLLAPPGKQATPPGTRAARREPSALPPTRAVAP